MLLIYIHNAAYKVISYILTFHYINSIVMQHTKKDVCHLVPYKYFLKVLTLMVEHYMS